MKTKLILIFLLAIVQTSWTQNCDFEISNLSSMLNGNPELIEKSEYEKISGLSEIFIEFTSMSELELIKKYPGIFKLKDSCYCFPVNNDNGIGIKKAELNACKNRVQSKEYSDFEFKGVYCDNVLIQVTGYEHWGFLSVDLKNGLTCFTMGKPMTSNGETAISYSNYYGEEEIALTDLKTKKQYVIRIEGWRTIESKAYQNSYYLKLASEFQTDCKKEIRYLKVKIKN